MAERTIPPGAADSGAVEQFMRGKALAATLAREAAGHTDGDQSDIEAECRCESEIAQERYVAKYLEAILAEPGLLQGFAAGLTHVMSGALNDDAQALADCVDRLSYEECSVHKRWDPMDVEPGPTSHLRVAWSATSRAGHVHG